MSRLLGLFSVGGALCCLIFANGTPDLKLDIYMVPPEINIGQPVQAQLELRNISGAPVALPGKKPSHQFFHFKVYDGEGKQLRYIGVQSFYLAPREEDLIKFKAGETVRWTEELWCQVAMTREGVYKVVAVYEIDAENNAAYKRLSEKGMWHGKVEAEVKLVVRAPQSIDKDAYDFMFQKRKTAHEKSTADWNAEHNANQKIPSDDDIRVEIGRNFTLEDADDLLEKFPSSIYTSYAAASRYKLDQPPAPIPPEEAHLYTPESVIAHAEKRRKEPADEYDRSKWQPEAAKKISELELIVKHQQDFVFIDRVYEALGNACIERGEYGQARLYFGKAAKSAKSPELKSRSEGFLKALEEK